MAGLQDLEITQLRELLAAVFQLTRVWLRLFVGDLVCAHVATLRKPLVADVA